MDIYAEVTNRIIAELENGIVPWKKPWTGVSSGAISRATGKPYSLINQIMLGEPGEYVTFKQCSDEGGRVKKGSKAKMVVFWKPMIRDRLDAFGKPLVGADGKPVVDNIPLLRYFQVFHIDDCEHITPKYNVEKITEVNPVQAAEDVMAGYVARSGVTLRHKKQNSAHYSPTTDAICLPLREQFVDAPEYYATLFHEAMHSSGHPSRLNRIDKVAAFGTDDYSKEELIAEIGSATIMNEIGIETSSSFRNSAAYIQSWLRALRNDKRMIISAAGKAEKGVKLILEM